MDVELSSLPHVPVDSETNGTSNSDTNNQAPRLSPRRVFHSRRDRTINYWQKLGQLFSVKRVRRALVTAVVCMFSQQLCGVNVLSFYSSTFFCDAQSTAANSDFLRPLFLSWGIGLTNFLFAFPAYWLIDRRGRRWLLLITLPILALTMFATAMSWLIPSGKNARFPVIGLFTYIFMIFYSWGMGPVPFTISAEVFPLEHRVVGMSFSVFCNFLGAGLLTLFVPALTNAMGHSGLLALFAGFNVIAFVLVFVYVRETAGATLGNTGSMIFMSLEELNYIFGVSNWKHFEYQFKTVLPWAWRYYVKRDQTCNDRPEKLYTWAVREQNHELAEFDHTRSEGEGT